MLGILTIATGEQRYIDMAKILAISLMKTNPEIPRAIVTDRTQTEFVNFYNTVVPCKTDIGKGLFHKLYLDKYTPFDETFFIDSDCLVIKSLKTANELNARTQFAVYGGPINTGTWYMDVSQICRRFNLTSIPLFNGGTYYFNDTPLAEKIYSDARNLVKDYKAHQFHEFRGSINEEPLMSIAMAIHNVDAVDDQGIVMRTPIGISGPLIIDALQGICSFNKEGEFVEPAIMHFPGAYARAFHYRRERVKLLIQYKMRFIPDSTISFIVNVVYNSLYATYVISKRVAKMILRGNKFNFNTILPVFSNN